MNGKMRTRTRLGAGLAAAAALAIGVVPASPAGAAPAPAAKYVVQRGDSLYRIAARRKTTVAALIAANGGPKAVRVIHPGQVLVVPASAANPASGGWAGMPNELALRPERLKYVPLFKKWAAAYAVPADLLMGLCWHESRWAPDAVSSMGATGMCQLMAPTAATMAGLLGITAGPAGLNLRDADLNIRLAARHLRYLLDAPNPRGPKGDLRFALTAYAQGLRSAQTIGTKPTTEKYLVTIAAMRSQFTGAR